ncbi:MAG: YCF48-related protein [Pseudomonadota bacterium]
MKLPKRSALSLALLGISCLLSFTPALAAASPLERPAISSALAARFPLMALTRAGDRIVAVGERGHILYSDDSGASWRQAQVPVSVTLTSVRFASAKLGWAAGHGGVILHSADGGQTWLKQFDGKLAAGLILDKAQKENADLGSALQGVREGADKPFLDLYFSDEQCGIAVGAYGLVFTTADGGVTWLSALDRLPNPEKKHLYAIRAVGNALYIAGEQGALFRSADGGKHFERLSSPYRGSLFDLVAGADDAVLLLGLRGNLFRSGDAGGSWKKVELSSAYTLTSATVLADKSLLLADEAGILWKSSDGGRSFAPSRSRGALPLAGIVQAANGSVIGVGARGVVRPALVPSREADPAPEHFPVGTVPAISDIFSRFR